LVHILRPLFGGGFLLGINKNKRNFAMANITSPRWRTAQPSNRNYLSPVAFKFNIDLFPQAEFFCQSSNLPGLSLNSTNVPTRYKGITVPTSGGVDYEDLNIKFLIDEDLTNYLSLFKWINKNGVALEGSTNEEIEYANAQLIILTNAMNANVVINFNNVYPVSLSGVEFDSGSNDIEYMSATVTFKYLYYEMQGVDARPL
jgi:hypothetical protein